MQIGVAVKDGDGETATGAVLAEAVVASGRRSGRSRREIAVDLYGSERVVACRHADVWMRGKLRLSRVRAGLATDTGREADADLP